MTFKERFKNLSPLEKAQLKDILWIQLNEEYERRPAKTIKEFIESEYYLNAKDECWDTIKDILQDFYESKKHIGVFIMPPGAGKSYLSSIIASYEVHKLLCLKEPHKKLGLAKGSNIAVMNMSQNGLQARKVVFGEIKARIENSFWFRAFFQPNPDKKSELEFSKNIFIIPGNSSETNPFGYNLVVVIMDEVAWWEMTNEKDYVKDTFETLEKRLGNRYGNKWNWKIVLISNPSYPDRYIESLIERPDVFGVRKAIWEVKPWLFSNEFVIWQDKWKIPKELEETARENPDIFKRDMLGIPSEVIKPWLINREALKKVISENKNPIKNGFIDWEEAKKKLRNKTCFIHIDLGLTGDACGICLCYKEKGKVVVGLVLRLKGSSNNPIKFSDVRQIVIGLRDIGVRIKKVSYDGWQSVDSRQILERYGFDVKLLSVDRNKEPYETLKELIYDEKILLPWVDKFEKALYNPVEAEEWLIKELYELEQKENKVDHKPKGSKDVSDALAGASYWAIQEPDYASEGSKFEVYAVSDLKSIELRR